MSGRIRAVVFDLDGLMVNSEAIFQECGRVVLQRRQKVMTTELLLGMMGRRAKESIQVMIDAHGLTETPESLIEETHTVFTELAESMLDTMPGLYELLDVIEKRNLPKGVATSSGRGYLNRVLGKFDLLKRFELTLTAEDVTHGKPHPEIYLTAAERLGVKPREMLVLEDSHAGSLAAARAGAVVVGIPHDFALHLDFSHATQLARRLDDPVVLEYLT
jgi:HAD superfamily hydrolase (TIGR01509 family)